MATLSGMPFVSLFFAAGHLVIRNTFSKTFS